MLIELPAGVSADYLRSWAQQNGVDALRLRSDGPTAVTVELDEAQYSASELDCIRRHLEFMDLFFWVPNGMHDVMFWERPWRWEAALLELDGFFAPDGYDAVTTIEARGFVFAGVQAYRHDKPLIPVRKFRQAFAELRGKRASYVNWRGYADELWLQELESVAGRRVLFIDDVLETGNSMDAAHSLLRAAGAELAGAFFLLDASEPGLHGRFGFPIRSLLRNHDLVANTAPAK